MLVRLNSGHFAEGDVVEGDNYIEKDCLLIYPGTFMSMDGEVEVSDEQLERLVSNYNSYLGKIKRLATGQVPFKDCPPVQLDHQVTATNTVGRVVGDLKRKEVELDDGTKVNAIVSRLRVMGKDNVEKVKDGRWVHLSVGADFDRGILSEVSITPFPAAPHAAMLSSMGPEEQELYKALSGIFSESLSKLAEGEFVYKNKKFKWRRNPTSGKVEVYTGSDERIGEVSTPNAAMTFVRQQVDTGRLSEGESGDPTELNEGEKKMTIEEMRKKLAVIDKCKKYLTEGEEKLSEEEAEKKLNEASDEELKKLSAEADEYEKKLSESAEKEKEAKLARLAKVTAVKEKLSAGINQVRLAQTKTKIMIRLGALKGKGKITPAEIKALDIDKLASSKEEVIEAALSTYEKREPVIDPRIYGSTTAMSAADLLKKAELTAMEQRARANMSSVRKGKTNLSDEKTEKVDLKKKLAEEVESEKKFSYLGDLEIIHKQMSEGKHEDAEKALSALLKKFNSSDNEDTVLAMDEKEAEKHLSALAESQKVLEDNLSEVTKLMAELAG